MSEQYPAVPLREWAARQPEVLALFVFGSRARGTATAYSDLDLAFVLDDTKESELSVLIVNRARWCAELTQLSGILTKDLYLRCDVEVGNDAVEVYRRRR